MILAGGTAIEILVAGDSLASNLWQGMSARFKNHANVNITRLTRNNSGLVRNDVYDWNKAIRTQMQTKRADIVVLMLGLNDAQRFPPQKITKSTKANGGKKTKPAVFSSPRWQEAYAARIDALLTYLRNQKAHIYWVGLPIMRNRTLSEDMAYINDILRERTERAGVKFIDIWDVFTGEDGGYSRFGPDLSGRIRNLRTKNGIHFTAAGARKLAHYPAREIFADFGSTPLARQSPRPGVNPAPRTRILLTPASPQPYGAPYNAPQMAIAPAGALAAMRQNPYMAPPPPPVSDKVLVQGEALQPVPGRADDFSWPRE